MCKMMTSPDAFVIFFFFFKFLIFSVVKWEGGGGGTGKNGKKWPIMTNNSVSLLISGNVPHMIVVFGTPV